MATILIVDDMKMERTLLRDAIEKTEHTVVGEAENGEEAFRLYKELKPDIVTMDITMPKMDGIEALTLIKHFDEDAKVIMVTAEGQKSMMVEALKRGAEDFFQKPVDPNRVIETINDVLHPLNLDDFL